MSGVRFSPDAFEPIAVTSRSGFDESLHHGAGAVVDADGAVRASIGDPDLVVYLRSSLKVFQTTAMVEHGLVVDAPTLALVSSSHNGSTMHVGAVRRLLAAHELEVGHLQNTPALPLGFAERRAAERAGVEPASLFQGCSGKHAGMLATCRINDWPIGDYLDVDHPLQRSITASIESLGPTVHHIGVDGCAAPTHALSLRSSAVALCSLAAHGSPVLDAMRRHPELVAGDGRDTTAWMRAVPGLAAKDGAEGVMVLVMLDGERRGWSAVFKVADGSGLVRAAVVPVALAAMGVDVDAAVARAGDGVAPPIGTGANVGVVTPLDWR